MATIIEAPTFDFTHDWFTKHVPNWVKLVPILPARDKFLEIGSFEGLSACWMLENMLSDTGELYCIDTWQGSPEFHVFSSQEIIDQSWDRFQHNTRLARRSPDQKIKVFRNTSVVGLSSLIPEHQGTFDFAYIDGSHMACDVLTDACLTFALLKVGGVIVFDDYLWDLKQPLTRRPKMAIDAFVAIFSEKMDTKIVGEQYILRKTRP